MVIRCDNKGAERFLSRSLAIPTLSRFKETRGSPVGTYLRRIAGFHGGTTEITCKLQHRRDATITTLSRQVSQFHATTARRVPLPRVTTTFRGRRRGAPANCRSVSARQIRHLVIRGRASITRRSRRKNMFADRKSLHLRR